MSFGLPPLKVKPDHTVNAQTHEGPFGVPDLLVAGLNATKPKLGVSHPLEVSERNYRSNQDRMNMAMLRNIQGLHAPLKLTMEMKFTSKVGHLPFLRRSNFQNDIITGRHIDIGFEDIFNTPELCEVAGQPHAVMERSLGVL